MLLYAIFGTTESALDSAQASLAPPVVLTNLCVLCVYALGTSDERTEPRAESKAEAVVLKRGIASVIFLSSFIYRSMWFNNSL